MKNKEIGFVYDLMSHLRKNSVKRDKVVQTLKLIDSLSKAVADGKATRGQVTKAQADLIPLCGFNFGLLIPTFFPRYPFDQPLDFSSRPFMFAMTAQAPSSVVTLKAGRQVGKCADGDTQVATQAGVTTLRAIFDEGIPV